MTLKYMTGFEGSVKPKELAVGCSWQTGRTGQSIYSQSNGGYVRIDVGETVAEGVIGFAWYGVQVSAGTTSRPIFQMLGVSGAAELTMAWQNTTLSLMLGSNTGTVLATATSVVSYQTWAYYEVEYKIAQAGGYVRVWRDGVKIIDVTGDTQGSADATPGLTVVQFAAASVYESSWGADDFYWLDLVDATATQGRANNERIGQPKIEVLVPNGNGATNQWVGSDANSVDNHLLVDENPPNAADYVESSTTGNRDLYEFSNPAIVGAVIAVDVVAHAASPDGGTNPLKVVRRSSTGTVVVGAAHTMSTTYKSVGDGFTTKDPDGTPWTTALVSASQFGVEVG